MEVSLAFRVGNYEFRIGFRMTHVMDSPGPVTPSPMPEVTPPGPFLTAPAPARVRKFRNWTFDVDGSPKVIRAEYNNQRENQMLNEAYGYAAAIKRYPEARLVRLTGTKDTTEGVK